MWARIATVPGVIASIIAIIAAGISVTVWIHSYFARQAYVETLKCYTLASDDSLSAQLESFAILEEFRRHKQLEIETLRKLQKTPDDAALQSDLKDATNGKEAAWEKRAAKLTEAREHIDRMNQCGI